MAATKLSGDLYPGSPAVDLSSNPLPPPEVEKCYPGSLSLTFFLSPFKNYSPTLPQPWLTLAAFYDGLQQSSLYIIIPLMIPYFYFFSTQGVTSWSLDLNSGLRSI